MVKTGLYTCEPQFTNDGIDVDIGELVLLTRPTIKTWSACVCLRVGTRGKRDGKREKKKCEKGRKNEG